MLTQEFVSTICGPPLAANTAISKDVGIYSHSLTPSHTIKASFKKSSTPFNGLAVSESHIFAAQDQKAHVHVYSRIRGNQEALVPFPERIRSLALAGQVLVVGSTEGRLFLWETCTGRLVSTPPCHVQAVSCLAVTPYHILSGSDDSNINVWSISRLLELDAQAEQEPDLTLSNHRGAITSLTVGPGTNPETSICLFGGDKPLLGSRSTELPSIVVQINTPLAVSDPEVGQPSCLALTYDGTSILSGHTKGKILRWSLAENGHPTDVANLNASVTNLCFIPPLSTEQPTKTVSIVKPNQSLKRYNFTAQLTTDLGEHTKLDQLLETNGIPSETLETAISSVTNPPETQQDDELARQDAQFRAIINSCNLLQDPIS
ncbi:Pre-rRNA-processing protein IPI3 [Fusarium odoratissimum]|uniref:Pre-rRNA-processing protein IPI3 n=1 Tax=Fusarium oxysporum f. sp. cubense (strain race 4) TaxID=2502994 RepID=N1R6E1_FUSC4|nr:Pre-rRNA-processing protein IPI3 [Fusarium odoratissimum]